MFDPVVAGAAAPGTVKDNDSAFAVAVLTGAPAIAELLRSAALRQFPRRAGNGFQHDGLLQTVLRTAAKDAAIVVARRGDRIATVWPLRFEHRHGLRLATDLASPFAQYSDVIGEPFDEAAFQAVRTILREACGVDVILCRGVRRDSGLAKALAGCGVVEETAAPFVDLEAFASFEHYCTRFSKQTARTRRQRRRRLEAQHGALGFSVLDGRQGRDAVARALQWKREWLDANGLSSRLINARDLQDTLLAAIDDPAAHVSVLSAQDRPIAVELGFSCAGNYAAFMGAFDPDFASYSPGQEQMLLTIEWCFAQGFARYDLLPPRDAYKLHWAREHDEERVSDHCVPLSLAGALYALARRYARTPVKRTVLSLPAGLRVAARRYGPAAAGIGATAATIGMLAD
jgi:CelD/BcsL family acetyltransferase involved in cellulose biosynthesis